MLLTHPNSEVEGQPDGPKVGCGERQPGTRGEVLDVCHGPHHGCEGAEEEDRSECPSDERH